MCGRFGVAITGEQLALLLELPEEAVPADLRARHNICPTQQVPIGTVGPGGERELAQMRWGLVPSWAKDKKIGARMINARAEGVASKPSFRAAFRRRRCLVPADAFYEWQAVEGQKAKQPWLIRLRGGEPFCMAGLWERWKDPSEETWLETFTIITTEANEAIAPLHHRMPVILHPDDRARWLDPGAPAELLEGLLGPCPPQVMELWPISTLVNRPANDVAAVREPITPPDASPP